MGKAAEKRDTETVGKLTLTLLRHAKATHDDYRGADIDRPLNKRGERNASAMGDWMAKRGLAPARIFCSPAARTRQTLDRIHASLKAKTPVDYPDWLYLAGPLTLLKHLHAVKKRDVHVLIIGHNPGLHALALDLIAGGPQDRIAQLGRKLPTCGSVVISFDVSAWDEVVAGTGTLVSFTTPSEVE
jgi:phosphohistidine phosphatase